MWNTGRDERKSAVINFDHSLTEETDLHLDAIVSQRDWAFRYAPSVGTFVFAPNAGLLEAINEAAAGSGFAADGNDWFVGAHRFVRHGNRDWWMDTEEYDVSMSLEGRIAEGLGYDARISAGGRDGFLGGETLVHGGRIAAEIWAGNYDLADPFSDAPEHLRAIEHSSLREENDFESEYQEARLALEGSGFAIGGRGRGMDRGYRAGAHGNARHPALSKQRRHDLRRLRGARLRRVQLRGRARDGGGLCGDVPAAGRAPGAPGRGSRGRVRRRGAE